MDRRTQWLEQQLPVTTLGPGLQRQELEYGYLDVLHHFGQSGHADGRQGRQRGEVQLSVVHVECRQQVQFGYVRAHLMLSVQARQSDGQVQRGEEGGSSLQCLGAGHGLYPTPMLTCNTVLTVLCANHLCHMLTHWALSNNTCELLKSRVKLSGLFFLWKLFIPEVYDTSDAASSPTIWFVIWSGSLISHKQLYPYKQCVLLADAAQI